MGKLSVKFLELRVEIDRRVRKCATGVASNAASTAELNAAYSHATSHEGKPAACGRVRSREVSPPARAPSGSSLGPSPRPRPKQRSPSERK